MGFTFTNSILKIGGEMAFETFPAAYIFTSLPNGSWICSFKNYEVFYPEAKALIKGG